MSSPPNILDRYHTFSYHHVLLACSNQKVVDKLSSEYGNDLERYENVQSFEAIPVDENNSNVETDSAITDQYFVVINGFKDSRYTIESVKWESLVAGSINQTDKGNSIAVQGDMQVREARGFLFLNVLNTIADQFKTDPTGITYLLKTFFVGHMAEDADGPRVIADIKPLSLVLLDVKGSFSPEGGIYNIDFVASHNGAARLPQISRAAQNVKFVPPSLRLKDVLEVLFAEMNKKSSQTYKDIKQAAKERAEEEGISVENIEETFRNLKFVVNLDPVYEQEDYLVDSHNIRLRNDTGEPAAFEFGRNFTIEMAIQEIMKRCQKVQDDATKPDEHGLRYVYKIHSSVTMEDKPVASTGDDSDTGDSDAMVVTYTIVREWQVTDKVLERALNQGPTDDEKRISETDEPLVSASPDLGDLRNSIIEYDYYFTGKNVDITKFDISMQQGLMFLQTLRTTNNSPATVEGQLSGGSANTDVVVSGLSATSSEDLARRSRAVVYPSTDVQDALSRNIGNPLSTLEFNAALSRQASFEQVMTNFSIRGNPYLLALSNTPINEKTEGDNTEPPSETRVLTNWDRTPSLFKINIKMPASNESPSSDSAAYVSGGGTPERLIDFWYTGFYRMLKIVHKFENGEFTQDIEANAVPRESLLSKGSRGGNAEVAEEEQTVDQNTTAEEAEAENESERPDSTQGGPSQRLRAAGSPRTAKEMKEQVVARVPSRLGRDR